MRWWRNRARQLDEMFYVLIGALALILGLLAIYLNWQKARQSDLLSMQSRTAVANVRRLQFLLLEAEAGQRGFLLTKQEGYLDPYRRALTELQSHLAVIDETGKAVPAVGKRYEEIDRLINEKMSEMRYAVQIARFGNLQGASEFIAGGQGKRLMDQLRRILSEVESETLAQEVALSQETQEKMQLGALLAVICCVGLFVLFAVENQRVLVRKRAAEHANEIKSSFMASMSHELRTPLNAIIGYSQMMQEEAEIDQRPTDLQDLQKIETAGKHLLELINSILEMSKIEAGKVEISAAAFSVPQLLDEVLHLVRPMAQKQNNTLELVTGPGVGRMYSDATKIRQCLLNLLSNACKFTQGGRITLRVVRVVEGNRPYLRFSVTDTGAGIPPEEMGRLFEPFSQLNSTGVRRKSQGTGLGLAITRRLTRLLGGDTLAQSERGTGSTFTLVLPEELMPGTLAAEHQMLTVERPVVLVIDDDPETHGLIRRMLYKQPLHVVSAHSAEEGLRLARELKPRVITLDIVMEKIDGWDVLQRIKSDPELASIPVILLSILDAQNDPRGFLAAEVMTKPVDMDKLTSSILHHSAEGRDRVALIVEDDSSARDLLRKPLERLGWQAYEAADGAEALEKFAEIEPGVVFLDLMMPNVDGFEFLSRLRQHPVGVSTPVIVVTAMDLNNDQRQRLNQQAAAVFAKGGLRGADLVAQVLAAVKQNGDSA